MLLHRERKQTPLTLLSSISLVHRSVMSPVFDPKKRKAISFSDLVSPAGLRAALELPFPDSKTFVDSIPFSGEDCTAGTETELQVAVSGSRRNVDLPLVIENSNYFENIVKRVAAGDTSRRAITELERFLDGNKEEVWENSWVRFPRDKLTAFAREVLDSDLLANKKDPASGRRGDFERFLCTESGRDTLRLPVSYMLKLAVANVLGSQEGLPPLIVRTGTKVMNRFLNDNSSPETLSFHVVPMRRETKWGRGVAKETAKRFLLTQLLVMYANKGLSLEESGQRVVVYFSPHPPVRQKKLNECISDSFYRELFMSPCLSGWDRGQEKHAYMCLCHQVLSRSQLNAVAKLREAGIITRNLVILPNLSNISLANNGTHVSLGSRKLTRHLSHIGSGFKVIQEKYVGDLVVKIFEHFLPLFVGSYSAAPYRLDFTDFHPETVLGFLPHEVDYTHLRMMWRRWKKKAHLRILGQPVTPFGLKHLDDALRMLFRIKGDFIGDFRLIDYLVGPMSTSRSPACDGALGNDARLKKDLSDLGVFDTSMALYLPYRIREFSKMGFSGFEGRYYSLFESLEHDLSHAVNLQALITTLAFKYILHGTVTHSHIPDDTFVESERRQIFFGSAIGIPTFYVRGDTPNAFMSRILARTAQVRSSRRYPGYRRVHNIQYCMALLRTIEEDAGDLITAMGYEDTVADLRARLEDPRRNSVVSRITFRVLEDLGSKSPLNVRAAEFNGAAERYYRDSLRIRHLEEAFRFLEEDLRELHQVTGSLRSEFLGALRYTIGERVAVELARSVRTAVIWETVSEEELRKLIYLVLISIAVDTVRAETFLDGGHENENTAAPIYRSEHRSCVHRIPALG